MCMCFFCVFIMVLYMCILSFVCLYYAFMYVTLLVGGNKEYLLTCLVIFSVLIKLLHWDMQCVSCTLSFSRCGHDRSHSMSCIWSFLGKSANDWNGTFINKNFYRHCFGKGLLTCWSKELVQETIFVQIRGHDLGGPNAEKKTFSECSRESDQKIESVKFSSFKGK